MKNRMALCNWSPIRTAPKTNGPIWVGAGEDMTLAYWGKPRKKGLRGGKPRPVKCWLTVPAEPIPWEPTHWQHIPNPPGA